MPFVHIRVAGKPLSVSEIKTLQAGATTLMAGVMRKKAELTAVLVEQPDVDGWSIGGIPAPNAAHLEVKVTAGTNTEDEKAAFVEQAHRLLKEVIGSTLSVATYVVIDEIVADAWGYDGRTQAYPRTAPESGMKQPQRLLHKGLSMIAAAMRDAIRMLTFNVWRCVQRCLPFDGNQRNRQIAY